MGGNHPNLEAMSVKLIIQTTKGIIRDQSVRRTVMFVIVIVALLMLFAGVTFLSGWLAEDRWIFLIYWVACMWLTMTSILLAIFDLLSVRLLLRRKRSKPGTSRSTSSSASAGVVSRFWVEMVTLSAGESSRAVSIRVAVTRTC